MSITEIRETEAYDKIDRIIENCEESNKRWFLTMDDLKNRIKKDIDKYYEFCLYILEACTPVTKEDKAVYKALNDYIKSLQVE